MATTSIASAPIASSAASLGIVGAPAVNAPAPNTGAQRPVGNAAVGTGFDPTPVTNAGNGGVNMAGAIQAAQAGGSVQYAAPQTAPAPQQPVSGGGPVSEFVGNAIERLAGYASQSMTDLKNKMDAEFTANGGNINMAKLQKYNQEMSNFEAIMSMAKKIQDTENEARRVWLR